MAAGVTDKLWEIDDLVTLLERGPAMRDGDTKSGDVVIRQGPDGQSRFSVGRVFDDGDQAGDHPEYIFGWFAATQKARSIVDPDGTIFSVDSDGAWKKLSN